MEAQGTVLVVSAFFFLLFVTVIFLKANTFATEQFALVEADYFIVKLLQRFDVLENATDGQDLGTNPRMNQTLTVCHTDGVWLRLDSSQRSR